jgi:hypothetical protein
MRVSGLRLWAVGILAAASMLASDNPAELKKSNPKELMKQAEADEQNDHWDAALTKLKIAAALKPKDKNIAEALSQAQQHLSEATAAKAMSSCNELKLDSCEQLVKMALSYMRSPRAVEADGQLAAHKAQLQTRWDQVQKMIGGGQLDEANVQLDTLSQFPYLFPTLSAEKERLRKLRTGAALDLGIMNLAKQQFDAAQQAFSAALRLDPGNAEAISEIAAVKKGKQAFASYQQAKIDFNAKKYEVAYASNQKALGLFPERQEYQYLDKQISSEWLKILEDAQGLNPNPENLKENQMAWESLGWIRRLDPAYQGLADATRKVKASLYSNYVQRAGVYQALPNNSGIGVAYLYHMNAQIMNPEPRAENPFAATFREVSSLFARKRAMQVLVNVENLSTAAPGFSDVVARRVKATIEGQGLPDLKVLSLDEYQKNQTEDPLFQDNRADGKSPIALFTVNVVNYESDSVGNDMPEEKPSKFISGQETVPNPDYQKAVADYQKAADSVAREKHKPGKPNKEGYTETTVVILQEKVKQTPATLTRDKLADYTYQEYHLSATATINMNLEIRDMLEKQLLGSDKVEMIRQDKATEIAGVRDKDVNGLINRPGRMKSQEQLVREAERDGLKALDEKVQALLARYTQRYYNEGEKALREGRRDDALENFVCYWYTFRGPMDEIRSQHIRETVKEYAGFDLNAAGPLSASP